MIGDGVMPSNAGRGYVLRRLLRRAARYGRLIGIKKPFLYEVVETVIHENASAYPELEEKKAYIRKIVEEEEKTFAKTVDKGFDMLSGILTQLKAEGKDTVSGEDAFKLSDTYGFPIDLTEEIAAEQGVSVDRERFAALVEEQRNRAREDYHNKAGSSWAEGGLQMDAPATVFTGYSHTAEEDAKVVAIFRDGESVDTAAEGEPAVVVLDKTPFYAESGGQIGDSGFVTTPDSTFTVETTSKTENGHYLHLGAMTEGVLHVGDTVSAKIDADKRSRTMRNHTAAHLLQAALRSVLGDHVHQAGQLVTDSRCRFDFSHFAAMTHEEIKQAEALVNEKILEAIPVVTQELPIAEARKLGAMALFGEKYGKVVRVVDIEGWSTEFCGGTHVKNTAQIGGFKIVSEASVAAGIRRIEAVTGRNLLIRANLQEAMLHTVANTLKANNVTALPVRAEAVMAENKALAKELEEIKAQVAASKVTSLFDNAEEIGGVKIASAYFTGTTGDTLRGMCDTIRDKAVKPAVAVLVGKAEDKITMAVTVTKQAQEKGLKAGALVKEIAAIAGGKGGGKPDFAMAGLKDETKIDEALAAVGTIVKKALGE